MVDLEAWGESRIPENAFPSIVKQKARRVSGGLFVIRVTETAANLLPATAPTPALVFAFHGKSSLAMPPKRRGVFSGSDRARCTTPSAASREGKERRELIDAHSNAKYFLILPICQTVCAA